MPTVVINSNATDVLLTNGVTGRKQRLIGLVLTATTSTTVTLARGASTPMARFRLLANQPMVVPPFADWELCTAEGEALRLTQGTGVQLDGFATIGAV